MHSLSHFLIGFLKLCCVFVNRLFGYSLSCWLRLGSLFGCDVQCLVVSVSGMLGWDRLGWDVFPSPVGWFRLNSAPSSRIGFSFALTSFFLRFGDVLKAISGLSLNMVFK